MSWHGIEGHDSIVARFREALARGRLASTFLFVGPAGIGKRTFALKLAQALLCQDRPASALDPCERCPACVQVAALTHPDLEIVGKPRDKSAIPVETFIGDREHRMQEGLVPSHRPQAVHGGPQDRDHRRRRLFEPGRGQRAAQDARRAAAAIGPDSDRHERRQAIADDPLASADRSVPATG